MVDSFKGTIVFEQDWDQNSSYSFMENARQPMVIYNKKLYVAVDYTNDGVPPDEDKAWRFAGVVDDTGAGGISDVEIDSDDDTILVIKKEIIAGVVKYTLRAVGVKGDKGDTGDQGEIGPEGPQGEQGIPGEKGELGEKGDVGIQGPKGETGEQGIQGPAGKDGQNGVDGKDGANGSDGIGLAWLTSTTSFDIGIGVKTFTTNLTSDKIAIGAGEYICIASKTNPTNIMEGRITAFSADQLTVNIDYVSGTGNFRSWVFLATGRPGRDASNASSKQEAIIFNPCLNGDPTQGNVVRNGIVPIVSTAEDKNAIGGLSFDAKTESITGLLPNQTYEFIASIGVKTTTKPTWNRYSPAWYGTNDVPASDIYAISDKNMDYVGGVFNGGKFKANISLASLTTKEFRRAGVLTNVTVNATIYPSRNAIGASTNAVKWQFYSFDKISEGSYLYAVDANGVVNKQLINAGSLTIDGDTNIGKELSSGAWKNWFQPIGTRGQYCPLNTKMSDKWSVVFFNGNGTDVQISNNIDKKFTKSDTFSTLPLHPDRIAIFRDTLISCYFSTMYKDSFVMDLNTGKVMQFTYPNNGKNVNVIQVIPAPIDNKKTSGFVAIDYTYDGTTYTPSIKFASFANPNVWNEVGTNILAQFNDIKIFYGICYNDIEQRFYMIGVDNNSGYYKTYILRSEINDLSKWSSFQQISGTQFTNLQYTRLYSDTSAQYAMLMTKLSPSGVENNVTMSSVDGGQFANIDNDLTLANTRVIIHPSGLIILSSTNTSMEYRYSLNGKSFITAKSNSNCQCAMLPLWNGFIRSDAGYNWYIMETTYRYTLSGTTYVPSRIFSGGQVIEYSVYKDSPVNWSTMGYTNYVLNADLSISHYGAPLPMPDDNIGDAIKIRIRNLNNFESVSNINAYLVELDNSTQFEVVCSEQAMTIDDAPATALVEGVQYILYKAWISTGNALNPSLQLKASFTDDTSYHMPNTSISIRQL